MIQKFFCLLLLFTCFSLSGDNTWIPTYIDTTLKTTSGTTNDINVLYVYRQTNIISLSDVIAGDKILLLFEMTNNSPRVEGVFQSVNIVGYIRMSIPHTNSAPNSVPNIRIKWNNDARLMKSTNTNTSI